MILHFFYPMVAVSCYGAKIAVLLYGCVVVQIQDIHNVKFRGFDVVVLYGFF